MEATLIYFEAFEVENLYHQELKEISLSTQRFMKSISAVILLGELRTLRDLTATVRLLQKNLNCGKRRLKTAAALHNQTQQYD